ncbi:FkbM family methyltransferase [uncultured Thiocystis sp.]|jgi:FkbM family methyltransferase|uniref:FkbM family methyltransferase n=1 Tax=uncultured Thiocystis sp. TaxID=1202134 RepID=UPI0025DA5150|nr:FkbM family methyltransferase [uncultured Thiocystis sp.]
MTTTPGLLEQAIAHHHAGRLDAAEHIYRALLALDSDQTESLHHLGVLEIETGRIDEGLTHLQRASEIAPEIGRYWLGLAQGLLIAQRPEDALSALDRAEAIGLDSPLARELRQSIEDAMRDKVDSTTRDQNQPGSRQPDEMDPMSTLDSSPVTDEQSTSLRLTIADDVRIRVPDDINCPTTYILLEQEDWFDEAMPFLRRLIQPGMVTLDVGANYGVYALTMAKRMRGEGKVIALEPARAPSAMLSRSIEDNGFQDVITLLRLGLSDHPGETNIVTDAFGEVTRQKNGDASESVRILTLDTLHREAHWPSGSTVDVLRLDVSGDIHSILKGGAEFLARQDPLIMFGLARGERISQVLLDIFKDLGMTLYRLIPALNALAPFDEDQQGEDTDRQRTLFACGAVQAEHLRQRGLMI